MQYYNMLIIFIFQVCFTFDVALDARYDVLTSSSESQYKDF